MVRRKAPTGESENEVRRSSRARLPRILDDFDLEDSEPGTPSKRRKTNGSARKENGHSQANGINRNDDADTIVSEIEAPTPRRRGRPPKANGNTATPTKPCAEDVVTPVKTTSVNGVTPRRRQAWDRSARKKSARALIEQVVGDGSDREDDDELVREIYESSEDEDEDEEEGEREGDGEGEQTEATTPSKTPKRRPGRPRKVRSPTPPRDLPPHELYFAHNKPGRPKTSNNTLASLTLLTHEEYFSVLRTHQDPHAAQVAGLEDLHSRSFPQWCFELACGFSICLFGLGSKRKLLQRFAQHVYSRDKGPEEKRHEVVIINGYVRTLTPRDIMTTIFSAADRTSKLPSTTQPSAMIPALRALLAENNTTLTLIIHSVDAPPLRRQGVQSLLAQLAALPSIQLISSADTPDFTLQWDSGLRSAFNFAFHDCTTFAPLSVEVDVVDEVHELLGRRARLGANGREGVAFVLRSLTQNAKDLYRLLVGEVLVVLDDEGTGLSGENPGVEYRMVYNKAVEEFICSSEMSFRGLLKEFHDHQMITSRKDAIGTELLSIPFRKDELEAILEDLMS